MHLAAFTGIGLVLLLGAIFYLGTDSLRGSLTGGAGSSVNVTITKEGAFSPNSVAIRPGDELVITNENPDPQVLKPKDTAELFSVQVLFDEPFSFVVPVAALGKTYTYFSETLPEDALLEISVVESIEQAAVSSDANSSEDLIPLPPILPTPESSESSSESSESSSSSSSSIPVVQASKPASGQPLVVALISSSIAPSARSTGQPSTFSLRPAAASESSSSLPSLSGNQSNLPNNPYTVGNRIEAERLGLAPSSSSGRNSSTSSSLKSGAPLRRITAPVQTVSTVTKKPRANVETGPHESMIIVTVLTMGMIVLYYRRVVSQA